MQAPASYRRTGPIVEHRITAHPVALPQLRRMITRSSVPLRSWAQPSPELTGAPAVEFMWTVKLQWPVTRRSYHVIRPVAHIHGHVSRAHAPLVMVTRPVADTPHAQSLRHATVRIGPLFHGAPFSSDVSSQVSGRRYTIPPDGSPVPAWNRRPGAPQPIRENFMLTESPLHIATLNSRHESP